MTDREGIHRLQSNPLHLGNVVRALVGKILRAVAIDVEYLDAIWVAVKETEDQSVGMWSWRLQTLVVCTRANEALCREIRVAFSLWRSQIVFSSEAVHSIR